MSKFKWILNDRERLSLLPIQHETIWGFRKKIVSLHWTAQEIDLSKDKYDWDNKLTPEERDFIRYQLAFFARIDIDVLENLDLNFGKC